MTTGTITSRKNPLVQTARAVRDGRDRRLVFCEGVRLCEEAVGAGLDFESAVFTESLEEGERGTRLLEALRRVCPRVLSVTEDVLESLSGTKTSQGIVALARRPETGPALLERAAGVPLFVIIHRANNPSNAGAMLRVAEAAGASGVISTKGSTDLFAPAALRGSMGSAFRLPVWDGATFEEALQWCARRGALTVAASAGAAALHTEIDWTIPRAVIVGPEAGGLSEEEAGAASERVRIPMRAPVESLNVATALAVVLYEAARQRGFP